MRVEGLDVGVGEEVGDGVEVFAGDAGEEFVEAEAEEGEVGQEGHGIPRERGLKRGLGGEGLGRGEDVGQFSEDVGVVHVR